ncbi:MAG: aminotransferase class I/II-fold pyridoxal phosphate-dependent enzyme [Planctomycetes bacterium]|nr:aminotransferase class I/II-fold pyridoxal phosphate-dependent enzyme [Planctomycetota bacterium]NOG55713.1 aminotransferase class I/II-fold pyridoxal phosphate-dependent enzyme [Planctomycetota bacterium]
MAATASSTAATAIDLRSDTVTRPTPAMLEAMVAAEVGDDVLGDDPTIIKLQEHMAKLTGKEAACFVPSGTMANGTAIRALTEPGDEIIGNHTGHFYLYESGNYAAISGCSVRLIEGDRGQFDVEDVRASMRPPDAHFPHSALVIIENTNNRGGGSVWPLDKIERVAAEARRLGLKVHLDGARLMNACVASGHTPAEYAARADTVSMCFSKGLGAPVGSIVAGSQALIRRVHRFRKLFGGTMRQSGYLAAAALYAIENNVQRLAQDHENARTLAQAIAELPGLSTDVDEAETNILYYEVDPALGTAADFSQRLEESGVRMLATGPQQIRAVTHLDVSADQIGQAIEVMKKLTH